MITSHYSFKPFLLLVAALILSAMTITSVKEVNAQNQYTTDIADRLKQRGVPLKYVKTISHLPYVIEIALVSSSTNKNLSTEDNWFMQLARREAIFAYRTGQRLSSFKLVVNNIKGEVIYSAKTYLYPEDINQKIVSTKQIIIGNNEAKEIIRAQLQLSGLFLEKLEITPISLSGNAGQVLVVQASTKNLETANTSLPVFLDSLFNILSTNNDQYGTYIVLCHFRLLDAQENVLLDYVKDLESGFAQWTSTRGLYNEWYPHLDVSNPIPPKPTPLPTLASYPPDEALPEIQTSANPYP